MTKDISCCIAQCLTLYNAVNPLPYPAQAARRYSKIFMYRTNRRGRVEYVSTGHLYLLLALLTPLQIIFLKTIGIFLSPIYVLPRIKRTVPEDFGQLPFH
jgi:hypothetical protein